MDGYVLEEMLSRIKALKKDKNITNLILSDITQISEGTLNKILAGQTKEPSVASIIKIAHALGTSANYLIFGEETPNNNFILKGVEQQLIEDFRELSPQGQEYILQTMNMAVNTYKKDNSTTDSKKSVG